MVLLRPGDSLDPFHTKVTLVTYVDPQTQQYAPQQAKVGNGFAIAALVLGIIAVLGCAIPVVNVFSVLLAIAALIFGILGLVRSKTRNAGRGASIAGLILAVVAFIGFIVSNILFAASMVKSLDRVYNTVPLSGKMNTAVKDRDLTFVVNSSTCGLTISDGPKAKKPKGQFCKVIIKVTNDGATPETFNDGLVEGIIGKFRYRLDLDATAAANEDPSPFVTRINPGKTVTAIAMIDIPVDTTLDGVRLQGSFMSDGVGVAVK